MLGRKTTILMYHSVNPTPDRYAVTLEQFQREVDFVRDRYQVVALKDIKTHLSAGRRRMVVFTFDDAFADFFESAYPYLRRRSIPSTVFVPTGHIGGWNSWDKHRSSIDPKRIMTASQLLELSREGLVDIGSHSIDHACMGRLSLAEMRRQAVDSRRCLEDMLQRPITMFSYPYGGYGDFTLDTEQVLKEAGYELAVTTRWGSTNSAQEMFRLRRISFARDASPTTVRARIEGYYDWKDLRDRAQLAWRSFARGGASK